VRAAAVAVAAATPPTPAADSCGITTPGPAAATCETYDGPPTPGGTGYP